MGGPKAHGNSKPLNERYRLWLLKNWVREGLNSSKYFLPALFLFYFG
jgi:hypothetical protein